MGPNPTRVHEPFALFTRSSNPSAYSLGTKGSRHVSNIFGPIMDLMLLEIREALQLMRGENAHGVGFDGDGVGGGEGSGCLSQALEPMACGMRLDASSSIADL